MKRTLSRLICLILCILLTCGCLFTTSFAANDDITLTVNDSFLPLSSSTMPVRRGGAQYVPYSVFSGTTRPIRCSLCPMVRPRCALTSAAVRYTIKT